MTHPKAFVCCCWLTKSLLLSHSVTHAKKRNGFVHTVCGLCCYDDLMLHKMDMRTWSKIGKKLLSNTQCTVFENHRKSLIQHCERSQLRLHFEWRQKLIKKCQNWSILASFWKAEACGQTVLPDRSVLIGQNLMGNAKIQKFKWEILSNFQTMCLWSMRSS